MIRRALVMGVQVIEPKIRSVRDIGGRLKETQIMGNWIRAFRPELLSGKLWLAELGLGELGSCRLGQLDGSARTDGVK